jgi:DNA-binding CsgD family transcriptional regulator
VAALAAQDAERVLRFVATAEELGGDDPFTPELLEELGQLVNADWVSYCEQDRVRRRIRRTVWRSGDEDVVLPVSYWEIAAEHPVCSRHNRGDFRALKLSDFLSLKELRTRRVYALWFRPWGVGHELNVAIPSPPWHTKTFLFDRSPGQDFKERDRLVLDLLQPHFGRLWRGARTRRQLRAALEGLQWASEQDARGVILVAPDGLIELASPPAARFLRDYFGQANQIEVPASLVDWLDSDSSSFVCRRGAHRLTVTRSGSTLLLEETRDELGLTARERQVLAWVARGKTNAEVAEMLWVSPTTIRKHLENVYAKLGVHTRTAAVTRFLGVLDREEGR